MMLQALLKICWKHLKKYVAGTPKMMMHTLLALFCTHSEHVKKKTMCHFFNSMKSC